MTRPTSTKAELEACRRRAVDLLELRHSVREVAEVVGVQPDSVSRWNAAYEEEGLAVEPRTNGHTPKLAEEHYPTPIQNSWTRQGRLSVFTALVVTLRDDEQLPGVELFFWIRENHYTGWIIYELLRDDLRYRWQNSTLVLDN